MERTVLTEKFEDCWQVSQLGWQQYLESWVDEHIAVEPVHTAAVAVAAGSPVVVAESAGSVAVGNVETVVVVGARID